MFENRLNITPEEIHHFFEACRLTRKKWYREIPDTEHLVYAYFVITRRMIQPAAYEVSETESCLASFLPAEVIREYHELKTALSQGGDLKKYHTQNSRILYPVDGLLEDWNINHLHLQKGKYQVYFVAEENRILMLKVVKHFARHHTSYSKTKLLEIWENHRGEKPVKNPLNLKYLNDPRISSQYPSAFGWYMTDLWKEKNALSK